MGKSIVYCDSCGKRLSQADFDSGAAHFAEDRPFCTACRPPDPAPESVTPRRHSPAVPGTSRIGTTRAQRKTSRGSNAPLWIGVGGGLGLLILIAALVSGGRTSAPRPRETPEPPLAKSGPAPLPKKPPRRKPPPQMPKEKAKDIEQAMKAEVESRRKKFLEREREARSTLGHWKLDDSAGSPTAADASASRQDGKLSGGPKWTRGKRGGALSFDGVDDGVTISSIEGLSPHVGPDGELTVSLWVKIAPKPAGEESVSGPAVAKGRPGEWEYALYVSTGGSAGLTVWQPGGSNYASVYGGRLSPDRWHHVAGVLRKGKFVRIFIDGEMKGESDAFKGDTRAGPSPLFLGRRGDARFFKGTIDEVRIYGRALGEKELQALIAADR